MVADFRPECEFVCFCTVGGRVARQHWPGDEKDVGCHGNRWDESLNNQERKKEFFLDPNWETQRKKQRGGEREKRYRLCVRVASCVYFDVSGLS